MIKICKEFKWEMGHRLMYHNGLCVNPHGHSYKMQVILEGKKDNNGMVMDYFELEQIVNEVINDFDHSFVVNEKDFVMRDFLVKNNFKYVTLPFDATAENLCDVFCDLLSNKLKLINNLKMLAIRIYETQDVYAERGIVLNY